MNRVDQTMFGAGEGNCVQACIASVLELPLDSVPHFVLEHGEKWLIEARRWLCGKYGMTLAEYFEDHHEDVGIQAYQLSHGTYCLCGGTGPRGIPHCVVGQVKQKGEKHREIITVFDPHPDREGLIDFYACEFFVVMNPAMITKGSQ